MARVSARVSEVPEASQVASQEFCLDGPLFVI